MAQNFNNFILKEKIDPQSNGPSIQWMWTPGSADYRGGPVYGPVCKVVNSLDESEGGPTW